MNRELKAHNSELTQLLSMKQEREKSSETLPSVSSSRITSPGKK
jgi:hypothetical protein